MDKAKLLNLFIIAFLVSLMVQYFFAPQKDAQENTSNYILQIKDDAITIPNIPHIELTNTTTGSFSLNPCSDIKISVDSQPIVGMNTSTPDFCKTIEITSGTKAILPLSKLYQVFAHKSGKYVLTATTPLGDRMTFFEVSAPGGLRTLLSTIVYQPIYNLFVALLTFLPGHSLGWAIIIVTIIIRLVLLVPQHHMLMSQKKMQAIQPKIKALQKEYKDDSATLGMKMIELYKKEDVNPFGAFVPLFIQMPILIGLYWVVSEINDPSNFYHLYSIFSEFRPTEISTNFYGFHLDNVGGVMGIILALVLGSTQWIQAYMSIQHSKKQEVPEPKKATGEETPEMVLDPEMMQKMTLYLFPIMIAVTSYFFPLGVGLYWFIGTLFVIVQQWYVNTIRAK